MLDVNFKEKVIIKFGIVPLQNEILRSMARFKSRHTANAILKQAGLPKSF